MISVVRLGGPAEETGDRVPGARLRADMLLALSGSLLAVVPFSLGRLIEAVNGKGPTPLAADPGFAVIAIGVLVAAAAIASVPVAVITSLLDRVVERMWLGPGGRLATGAVAHALFGAAAGLVLVFTGPWAAAAAMLFLLASTTRRPGRRPRGRA